MTRIEQLGEVTCPSGDLVFIDGGYLDLWSDILAGKDPGISVITINGLPTDRVMPVLATAADDWGWSEIRVSVSDAEVARTRELGPIIVDEARIAVADRAALASWVHEESLDGLADVVFWGRDDAEIAAEFGAGRVDLPGDNVYGWLNLPLEEAYAKAVALNERRGAEPERRFAFDYRPHSHHWQVMAGVRASEHEAATIELGGARILFAMTSVGDGYFPVHLDLAADDSIVAIRIAVQSDEEDDEEEDEN